jgi:hypothetical protein
MRMIVPERPVPQPYARSNGNVNVLLALASSEPNCWIGTGAGNVTWGPVFPDWSRKLIAISVNLKPPSARTTRFVDARNGWK